MEFNNVKSIEKNEKNIESYGRHTLLSANVSDFGVSTDDTSSKSQLCTMILKKKRPVRMQEQYNNIMYKKKDNYHPTLRCSDQCA